MQAIYHTKTPEETIALGEKLAYHLSGGDTVLLYGDLGSGKTHFTKGIAKGLGIKETIKSPTFAYVNKYNHLYHYDLYRLNPGDDLTSIGLTETLEDSHAINIIEWADRITELPPKYVHIDLEARVHDHKITIRFTDPEIVPKNKIDEFYTEWGTPWHVRDHIKQVTAVAMDVAGKFIAKGEIINLNLLYSATMLHDLCRVCDFGGLVPEQFKEPITPEKWEKWQDLRKCHAGFHHADIAERFLKELGYPKTAELVYIHKSRVLVEEPERINTLEKKIMYYADKRVKHDEIVSLEERFRDGRIRHGRDNDTPTRALFDEVEKRTFLLEKELLYN